MITTAARQLRYLHAPNNITTLFFLHCAANTEHVVSLADKQCARLGGLRDCRPVLGFGRLGRRAAAAVPGKRCGRMAVLQSAARLCSFKCFL